MEEFVSENEANSFFIYEESYLSKIHHYLTNNLVIGSN